MNFKVNIMRVKLIFLIMPVNNLYYKLLLLLLFL